MSNIQKPNDILVSTLLNPQANVADLMLNGINAENTQLLSPGEYKDSGFIKKSFADDKNNFNEDLFNQAYLRAAKQFEEMTNVKSFKDLENYTKYNYNDLYAPITSQKEDAKYEMSRSFNTYRTSKGVSSLFGEGEQTKSIRELAQQSKIWDSENNQWMDKTADELGLFGTIFSKPLVYATWDENGTHIDPVTGKEVAHKKGDWKLNEDGQFYTETLGDREGYGKQFVAASDTLTKEDSWINKIDFFDSDGIQKNPVGTTFKLAAEIFPYMIPYFNVVWGGVNAATQLAAVMPTFAKMMEGIAIGDKETAFTRKMNIFENYWKKYDDSYSDDAQDSSWGLQKMASLVGDIFGQLYQMRAIGTLSNLKFGPEQKKIVSKFHDKFASAYALAAANPESGLVNSAEGYSKFFSSVVNKVPEMKNLIDAQSALSSKLALGYMALTSSADVYSDALQHGYDRRMAGAAGLLAAAGQYGIMMGENALENSIHLGTWFLDRTGGDPTSSLGQLKKLLRPYYDDIAKGVAVKSNVSTQEKLGILAKLYKKASLGIKELGENLRDGSAGYLGDSLREGLEEVTEETVMDATKGIFDFLSWLGVGKNAGQASFDVVGDFKRGNFLDRYLQNFVGGAVGGSLFRFQQNVMEPGMMQLFHKNVTPDVKSSIIREIANGNLEKMLKAADSLGELDSEVAADGYQINDHVGPKSVENQGYTRGQVTANGLKNYLKYIEGLVIDEGINVSDDVLFKKALRDYSALSILERTNVQEKLLKDYTQLATEIIDIRTELDNRKQQAPEKQEQKKEGKEEKTSENKTEKKDEKKSEEKSITLSDGKYSSLTTKDLQDLYTQKKQEANDFLNGNKNQKYLKLALGYLSPAIRSKIMSMSVYDYTRAKYGKSFSELPETGATLTKESVTKEYKDWRNSGKEDEIFDAFVIDAFDDMNKKSSKEIKDYDKSAYGVARDYSWSKVLSRMNLQRATAMSDDETREILVNVSERLRKNGLPGLNVNDVLQQNPKRLKEYIENSLDDHSLGLLRSLPNYEEAIDQIVTELTAQLEQNDYFSMETTQVNDLLQSWIRDAVGNQLLKLTDGLDTKEQVDAKLIELGFSPVETNVQNIKNYFKNVVTSNIVATNGNIGFHTSLLLDYFDQVEKIDSEVFRILKRNVLKEIISKRNKIKDVLKSFKDSEGVEIEVPDYEYGGTYTITEFGEINFLETELDNLNQIAKVGLDANQSIDQMIDKWLNDGETGIFTRLERTNNNAFKALKKKDPNIKQHVKEAVIAELTSPATQVYESARHKEILDNKLFNLLRTANFELSEDKDNIIFDILEEESKYLEGLDSASEYNRQGYLKDKIENAIATVDLMQAVAISMTDEEVDILNPFSYNAQIRRYLEKWEDGKDVEKYVLMSPDSVFRVNRDLELVKQKLGMLKELNDSNAESKKQRDKKTKDAFQQSMLRILQEKGSKLTIGGVSIYPGQDEINKYDTDEAKLVFIQEYMHNKFVELSKNNIKKATNELLTNSTINAEAIRNSHLESYGLDPNTEIVSEYDYFVWLISTIAVNKQDFLFKYRKQLQSKEYSKVPFFSQQYAAEIAYSFANDTIGVHDRAVDWLYDGVDSFEVQKAKGLLFVDGVTGAGKTSTTANIDYNALPKDAKVFITAPNERQINTFKEALQMNTSKGLLDRTTVGSKEELYRMFLSDNGLSDFEKYKTEKIDSENSPIKQKTNDKGLYYLETIIEDSWFKQEVEKITHVYIDEATHFTSAELMLLSKIHEKFDVKFELYGDSAQNGAEVKVDEDRAVSSNVSDVFTWKTPKLLQSIRPAINLKIETVSNLYQAVRKYEELTTLHGEGSQANSLLEKELNKKNIQIPYYESDTEIYGDKFVQEITVEDIKKLFTTAQKESDPNRRVIGVLTKLDSDKEKELRQKLKDAGLQEGDYKFYSFDNFHKDAVQGAEQGYFIIDNFGLTGSQSNLGKELKALYTFVTRSLSGSIINESPATLLGMHVIQDKRSRFVRVETPQSDEQSDLKKTRVAELDKLLENYTAPQEVAEQKTNTVQKANKAKTEQVSTTNEDTVDSPTNQAPGKIDLGSLNTSDGKFEKETNVRSLHGYTFYNHLGVPESKDHKGWFDPQNTGSALDLDGLLSPDRKWSPYLVQGFTRFKNLCASTSDLAEEEWNDTIDRDNSIVDFFLEIIPTIAQSDDDIELSEEDKRRMARQWIKTNIKIDPQPYAFVIRYKDSKDSPYGVQSKRGNANDNDKLVYLYGKRIYSVDGNFNQYISFGSFPNFITLDENGKTSQAYNALDQFVKKNIQISDNFLAVTLNPDQDFHFKTGIRFVDTDSETHFTSIYQMQRQGLVVDTDNIIIADSTQDNDGHFEVLKYIAKVESDSNQEAYIKRLQQLEDAFVIPAGTSITENGITTTRDVDVLKISGKYITSVSFVDSTDPTIKRFVVMDPKELHLETAIRHIKHLSPKGAGESKSTLLDKKHYMSTYSQNNMIMGFLDYVQAWDENGEERIISIDGNEPRSILRLYLVKLKERAEKAYKNGSQDLTLLTELLDAEPGTLDRETVAKIVFHGNKDIRGFKNLGILFIDEFIRGEGTEDSPFTLKNLIKPRTESSLVIDFNSELLPSTVHYSFSPQGGSQKTTYQIGEDTFSFWQPIIDIDDTGYSQDFNQLGIYGHYVQMPLVALTEELIGSNFTVIRDDLEHNEIDFSGLKEYNTRSTKSLRTLEKQYDPKAVIIKAPEYVYDKSLLEKDDKGNYKYYGVKKSESGEHYWFKYQLTNKENGVNVQVGDEVFLYGDESNSWTVGFLDTNSNSETFGRMQITAKNGVDLNSPLWLSFTAVSGVKTRILLNKKFIGYDYYRKHGITKESKEKMNRNKEMTYKEFNPKILDFVGKYYVVIPFTEEQSPEEVITNDGTIVDTVESAKAAAEQYQEDNQGIVFVRYSRRLYPDPLNESPDGYKSAIEKMRSETTSKYIAHVIYYKGEPEETITEIKPEKKESVHPLIKQMKTIAVTNGLEKDVTLKFSEEQYTTIQKLGKNWIRVIGRNADGTLSGYITPKFYRDNDLEAELLKTYDVSNGYKPIYKVNDWITIFKDWTADDIDSGTELEQYKGWPKQIVDVVTESGITYYMFETQNADGTTKQFRYTIADVDHDRAKYQLVKSTVTKESAPTEKTTKEPKKKQNVNGEQSTVNIPEGFGDIYGEIVLFEGGKPEDALEIISYLNDQAKRVSLRDIFPNIAFGKDGTIDLGEGIDERYLNEKGKEAACV